MTDGKRNEDTPSGRFSYDGLERVIHEKARLGIMTSLVTNPNGLLFSDLKESCSLTDGNLSRHLEVLRKEGLVQLWKGTKDNRPQTLCQLTELGRKRFLDYLSVLEQVIADGSVATQPLPGTSDKLVEGLSPA